MQVSFTSSKQAFPGYQGKLTVRSGRGAAVGGVTESVHMHATLSGGIMASDVPCDGSRGTLGGLFEGDGASDLGVTAELSN